jgi:hypothetical protein
VDAGFLWALTPAAPRLLGPAEELSRVDTNVPTALLATGLGLQPIIHFGTDEQQGPLAAPLHRHRGRCRRRRQRRREGLRAHARASTATEWVISGGRHYTAKTVVVPR